MENKNSHIDQLKNNFSTPENYFEKFEDQLMAQIKLEGIEKKNNFKTPETYFSTINLNPPVEETKVIPFNRSKTYVILRYVSAIAAIVVLAIFIYTPDNKTVETTTNIAISTEDLHEDLDDYTSTFEDENLIAMLEFDEALEEKENYYFNQDIDLVTTSDEIEEYLSSDTDFDVNF